jgi:hypothetical protein
MAVVAGNAEEGSVKGWERIRRDEICERSEAAINDGVRVALNGYQVDASSIQLMKQTKNCSKTVRNGVEMSGLSEGR